MAVYTLAGSGRGLRKDLMSRLAEFTQEYGDLGVEKYDASQASLEDIVSALESMPFLSPKKCVVLEDVSLDKLLSEKVMPYIESAPESTDIIIVEPAIDKRVAFYKWLQKNTSFTDYTPLNGNELTQKVIQDAQAAGADMSRGDAQYLIERVGGDEHVVMNELSKLSLYEKIDKGLIDEQTVPSFKSKIFDLLDAAAKGDSSRALDLYADQRAQKVEPQQIMAMLIWQLQIMMLAATAKEPLDDVAKQAGVSAYPLKQASRSISGMSASKLIGFIDNALAADKSMRVDYSNPDETTKLLILQLCS